MESKDTDTTTTNGLDDVIMRYTRLCGFIGSLSYAYSNLLQEAYLGNLPDEELDRMGWELSYIKEDSERILDELQQVARTNKHFMSNNC